MRQAWGFAKADCEAWKPLVAEAAAKAAEAAKATAIADQQPQTEEKKGQ